MIEMRTEVHVKGISGKDVSDFMLHCTNADYRNWWPGTHLVFVTAKRFPKDIGNTVFFDEYVGKRRLKIDGRVVKHAPGKEIVWQMLKGVPLPAWLALEFVDDDEGVHITHTLRAGFAGIGRMFDPVLRLYLNEEFMEDMEEHAHIEFTRLGEIITGGN
jgi:hypothetical protein